MSQEMKKEFFDFITARQRVAFNRQAGKPLPWSDDEILNKFKFCNVFRELDRGTIHLFDNVLHNESLTREEKAFNVTLYRFFNRDGFFSGSPLQGAVRFPLDKEKLSKEFADSKSKGEKLFNNAYTIFVKKTEGSKLNTILNELVLSANAGTFKRIAECETMQGAFSETNKIKHCGNFFSYQIAIDMSYISNYLDGDFVVVGPGAVKGLEKIFGLSKIGLEKAAELCKELWLEQGEWLSDGAYEAALFESKYLPSKPALGEISISNIQNCLCEFRKYHNIKNGLKQRRRLFKIAEATR